MRSDINKDAPSVLISVETREPWQESELIPADKLFTSEMIRDMLGTLRTRRVARATLYQRSAMRDILLLQSHGRSRLHLSRGCGCATSTPFYLEGRGVGCVCLAAGARYGAGASENPVNENYCGATAT